MTTPPASPFIRYRRSRFTARLPGLANPSLKGLLRRVIGKIFSVEIQGLVQ